jgi:hypothetical protein
MGRENVPLVDIKRRGTEFATATSKETMNDPNDEKLPPKKARRGELVDDDKQEAMKKEEKKREAEMKITR